MPEAMGLAGWLRRACKGAVLIGVGALLNQCGSPDAALVHPWGRVSKVAGGFDALTWDGIPFYRFRTGDLVPIDDKPIESYSPEERERLVEATMAGFTDLARFEQPYAGPEQLLQFAELRFSVPYQVKAVSVAGGAAMYLDVYNEGKAIEAVRLGGDSVGRGRRDIPWGLGGPARGAKAAQRVAAEFFPPELRASAATLERMSVPAVGAGDLSSFWRLANSPAPYLVGSDGFAYRVQKGYCLDPNSRLMPAAASVRVQRLETRESAAASPCEAMDVASAVALSEGQRLVQPGGARTLAWGTTEAAVRSTAPDIASERIGAGPEGKPDLLEAFSRMIDNEQGSYRFLGGPGGYALLAGESLVGALIEISDREYQAYSLALPERFGEKASLSGADRTVSCGLGIAAHSWVGWRDGQTMVALLERPGSDDIRYGIALLEAGVRLTR